MTQPIPVFDGHNDLLLRLSQLSPDDRDRAWLKGDGKGHMDLPRMKQGGFSGGFFAAFVPSPMEPGVDFNTLLDSPPYDMALPSLIAAAEAQPVVLAMAGQLMRMESVSDGQLRLCRNADEVRACMAEGAIAAVFHIEGAEAIGPDLDALHGLHGLGLRSLGPVWSRPTIFGHGVPFRFPGDPDTGPGLTPVGCDLVRACNELRLVIDLSHLNQAGFDDVARISAAPLVATHSNAHAICPSTRNLTDRQLRMIAETGGMVGLNFATVFLRPDGRRDPAMGWDPILRHLDHLIGILGEDHVGLGSDFDCAPMPEGIGDVTGLPALMAALAAHGYDDALLRKIAHGNWLGLLERTIG